jgi:hypothetical protein
MVGKPNGFSWDARRALATILALLALEGCAQVQTAGVGGVSHGIPAPAPEAPAAGAGPARPILAAAQLQSLNTLTGRELIARLGMPDFMRRDPPSEIWQYRSAACVLDVYLFTGDGESKVAYLATRDRRDPATPANGCTPFAPPAQTASAAPVS